MHRPRTHNGCDIWPLSEEEGYWRRTFSREVEGSVDEEKSESFEYTRKMFRFFNKSRTKQMNASRLTAASTALYVTLILQEQLCDAGGRDWCPRDD
jgi:hypothetical protein